MNKKKLSLILSGLLVLSAIIPFVFADSAIDTERFSAVGNLGIVANGLGLDTVDSSDITINVPGDAVIAAYLYWAGFDYINQGDDEVLFDDNTVEADQAYTDLWLEDPNSVADDKYHYVYVADVTEFVNLGPDTYTVDEFQVGDAPDSREYGAGLIVVYEDDALPLSRVTIMDGLDSYYWDFPDPRGPNSEIFSLDLDPNRASSEVEMVLFAGGTGSDNDPNNILIATGAGALPDPIITDPITPIDSLITNNGAMWDTYQRTIPIEVDDEWLCVQVESIHTDGASGLLIGAGFVQEVLGGGKVTGGGQIELGDGKNDVGSFGFNAMWFSRDDGPKGELEYLDHVTRKNVHAHIVNWLIVWEPREGNKPGINSKAIFTGPCTINQESGYRFEVYVEDNCEPGVNDVFSITVWNDANQVIISEYETIIRGNIQIHKPPK